MVDAGEALAQVPHHYAGSDATDVEQHQLDDAACPGTLYASEEDEEHDEHAADDGCPGEGDMEQAGDHGRGGEHLRHDADEDADEEKGGADGFGLAAIFFCHDFQEGGAAAATDGSGINQREHQRSEGGPDGKPPGRYAVTEGQLCGADGGLAAHQGAQYGPANHPAACTAAGGERFGIFDLAARMDAYKQQ